MEDPMTARYSQACENNQAPILQVLSQHFANTRKVLEIGSGTGQHCVYFARRLSHLFWQPSDLIVNHPSILAWQQQQPSDNLGPPIAFCVGQHPWPLIEVDGVFTANTTHIMQPSEAKLMMQLVAENLPVGGFFCQYGPFNINGGYTSESNRQFDQSLQAQGYGGIRDIDELTDWAQGLELCDKVPMPANNLTLVWSKK